VQYDIYEGGEGGGLDKGEKQPMPLKGASIMLSYLGTGQEI